MESHQTNHARCCCWITGTLKSVPWTEIMRLQTNTPFERDQKLRRNWPSRPPTKLRVWHQSGLSSLLTIMDFDLAIYAKHIFKQLCLTPTDWSICALVGSWVWWGWRRKPFGANSPSCCSWRTKFSDWQNSRQLWSSVGRHVQTLNAQHANFLAPNTSLQIWWIRLVWNFTCFLLICVGFFFFLRELGIYCTSGLARHCGMSTSSQPPSTQHQRSWVLGPASFPVPELCCVALRRSDFKSNAL